MLVEEEDGVTSSERDSSSVLHDKKTAARMNARIEINDTDKKRNCFRISKYCNIQS